MGVAFHDYSWVVMRGDGLVDVNVTQHLGNAALLLYFKYLLMGYGV